jgi:hypothetical protein
VAQSRARPCYRGRDAGVLRGTVRRGAARHRLEPNRSVWRSFITVRTERWWRRTWCSSATPRTRPTLGGSGTKLAMEDAVTPPTSSTAARRSGRAAAYGRHGVRPSRACSARPR